MKNLVEIWSRIITFDCTWVLFTHGSCVVLPEGTDRPRQAAREILGQAAAGSGPGSVIRLTLQPGWVVTASHPDVLTYVGPADVGAAASDVTVAYYGAAARAADARELAIVCITRGPARPFSGRAGVQLR